jgi:Tfp pilus assembly protein PilP
MRIVLAATVVVTLIAPAVHAYTPPQAGAAQAKSAQAQTPLAKPAAQPPATAPAQPPAAAPAPPLTPPPAAATRTLPPPVAPASQPPSAEAYTYRADGRRDPFRSLIGSGADTSAGSRRGDGPAGMTLGEISVRGIMQSRGSLVAMIQGPDNKTYLVHQGDKLLDGTIKTITPQGLIVIQEVNDPLSLVKQREVRKLLRSLEDAKE